MTGKNKTQKEKEEERQLRQLAKVFEKHGVSVRREKLSRGRSFRVKSGDCLFTGKTHVFVDRRLPGDQQLALLVDYLLDFQINLDQEEMDSFSPWTKNLLSSRGLTLAAQA